VFGPRNSALNSKNFRPVSQRPFLTSTSFQELSHFTRRAFTPPVAFVGSDFPEADAKIQSGQNRAREIFVLATLAIGFRDALCDNI